MPSFARVLLLSLLVAAGARGQAPVPAPLGRELPALDEQSVWAQDTTLGSDEERGIYPIGNGLVFAHLGRGPCANSLAAITGPDYGRTPVGNLTTELRRGGESIPLPRQRVRRVRGAAIVVTEDAAPTGIALRALTFVTPAATAITRVLEVHNLGATDATDVELVTTTSAPARAREVALELTGGGATPVVGRLLGTDARAAGTELITALPPLPPGGSWRGVQTVHLAKATTGIAPTDLEAAGAAAATTLSWWRDRLAATLQLDSDHRRLVDLVTDQKVRLLTQRSATTGAIAAMADTRRVGVRECSGIVLGLLRLQLWSEARELLRYLFAATRATGALRADYPVDLAFDDDASAIDWAAVEVPESELPSWVVLQHFWYWRATRDTGLIRAHWPLLEICLKRQRLAEGGLLPFEGSEAMVGGGLHRLIERAGDAAGFVANAPDRDRRTYSFNSSVLFVMALHGAAELVDAIDQEVNPGRWLDGPPDVAPGDPWMHRGFQIFQQIEERYWLPERGHFAAAISPVNLRHHEPVVADAALLPNWIGWTYPSGDRRTANARAALSTLWRDGMRFGATPGTGFATGTVQAMALCSLAEHLARERDPALGELIEMARPAGGWADLRSPAGTPVPEARRLCPDVDGINIDAILFALTGIRCAVPLSWARDDVRLNPRLPPGARYLTLRQLRGEGRILDVYVRDTMGRLSATEREQAGLLPEELQRDPELEHRRLAFRVELHSDNPERGYYDATIRVSGRTFVRYLHRDEPIDESTVWIDDDVELVGEAISPAQSMPEPGEASVLVLTARTSGAKLFTEATVTVVDTGLPHTATALAKALERHHTVYFDWGFDEPGPATGKTTAFWRGPTWRDALAGFEARGGKIVRPGYATQWRTRQANDWHDVEAPGGRLVASPGARARVVFVAEQPGRALLHLGSGCGLDVTFNAAPVYARSGARSAVPDRDTIPIDLLAGENLLEVELLADGEPVVFARLTDLAGWPLAR